MGRKMKVMYLDCFAGIAGDMFLGALIDAGADIECIREGLSSLDVNGYSFVVEKKKSYGIAATKIDVIVEEEQPHRHLKDIVEIIETGSLSDYVKDLAKKVFMEIAQAEAKVHGTTIEHVHFHEVGAVDSICDVIGSLLAVENIKVDKICCSHLPMGYGSIKCDHGLIPLPAPATLEIIKGIPVRNVDVKGELVTPTGAALAKVLAKEFNGFPNMIVECSGYGLGTRDYGFPNVLRVVIGQEMEDRGNRDVVEIHHHSHE
ncbi:MAG: LarC family nickel insertion protein [Eubacteriales bacterium]